MNISALLNPESEGRRSFFSIGRAFSLRRTSTSTDEDKIGTPAPKSTSKEAKDAPKFEKGDPVGEVKYPPFYVTSSSLRRQMKRYAIFPESGIESYPRHIPYSSEKKRFSAKTGRDAFEVLQYTFRYNEKAEEDEDTREHEGEKSWTVMWDYNVGLVRITPFFKCQEYQKTIPAKVIGQNTGLGDLCHSITGGALAAQGYWMPYQAAKMIAATFCWKIRYALIPLFGPDFLDICTHPSDPAYKRFTIDPAIIEQCVLEHSAKAQGKKPREIPGSHPTTTRSLSPAQNAEKVRPRPLRPRASRKARIIESEETDKNSTPAATSPAQSEADTAYEPLTPASLQEMPQASTSSTAVDRQWEAANKRVQKRRFCDTEPESSPSTPPQMPNKRKRKIGHFTVDEARAAYQLLELRYSQPDDLAS